jgi:hypothetical protein
MKLPAEPLYMTGRIDIKRSAGCLALGLAMFFAAMDLSVAATNETDRLVSADLRQTNGPLDTMFKFCVGAGRANEGLRADWQRQLTYAHRECGFEYIRMHGLFATTWAFTERQRQAGIQLAIH